MTTLQSASRITVAPDDRVEQLRQKLGYPVQQRDPQGSDFFYLRPGSDVEEAAETCPIAVGFYSELNKLTDERSLQQLLTSSEWQQRIYGHYVSRTAEQQPVMYILMPTEEGAGQVPLILPTEGGLRQRNIQTFAWGSAELETRLNRLRQEELPVAARALTSVPLVERAFYKPIQTAKELAQLLATAARRIEQILPEVYQDEKRRYPASKGEEGYLHKLLKSFQQELLPSLQLVSENEKDYSFSDIYAQTIAYSLFTARVFGYVRDRESGRKESLFDRQSAWQQLPETNPFLRKLFQDVSERSPEELGDDLIGTIADIFAILRAAKMDVILQDFRQKQNREDIVIRFYEDFLAVYKPDMRDRRGVYYTPEPVVSYLVRSVDVLLKEKFNKPLGLADPEVMILDPACGTGTFLLWIFQLIHDRFHVEREAMIAKVGDISWSEYVSAHLLPRIFGFELLMAPYAIAHLKLGLFLEEKGYQFSSGKRLGIFLTNALEQTVRKSETLLEEFIAEEANEATEIKNDKKIMVVIGNPPYSVSSENKNGWIAELINDYKKDLGEKKINLDDDYIKFLRFSQWRVDRTGHGILAFITNNSYLQGLTHRRMRQSLAGSFDEIYVLDLHGNSNKKERCSDGSDDENVFAIQQGVSLGIFTKTNDAKLTSQIKHSELWGTRDSKYEQLSSNNIATMSWQMLQGISDESCLGAFHFFAPKAFENIEEYCQGTSLKEIFVTYQNGIKTDRDELFFDFSRDDLEERMKVFYSPGGVSEPFRSQYRVEKSSSYDLLARRSNTSFTDTNIRQCLYRPFDTRWLYYSENLTSRPAWKVMKHMMAKDCLGLITTRQTCEEWSCLVTQTLCGHKSCAAYDINSLFPLYLQSQADELQLQTSEETRVNFSPSFLEIVKSKLSYTPEPETIFYYIYAIFHSPTYRTRYAEFLKIDFPRVPLTSNASLFHQMVIYGEQLVALHLMKSTRFDHISTEFIEQGGDAIVDPGHPKYSNGKVTINKKGDGFVGVSEAVWNFYVGGYQVCAKWLKDRKGRTLTQEDIVHYQRIIVTLQETMRLMQLIDEAIPQFPIS